MNGQINVMGSVEYYVRWTPRSIWHGCQSNILTPTLRPFYTATRHACTRRSPKFPSTFML